MELKDGPVRLEDVAAVAEELSRLEPEPFVFGASILPLYLRPGPLRDEARPTDDVDVLVHVPDEGRGPGAVRRAEVRLEEIGWVIDGRPRRRNRHAYLATAGVPVDVVLDAECAVDDWVLRASRGAARATLHDGRVIRIPTPAFFLACKIAASRNPERWQGSYVSRDVEDIVLLVCGCDALVASVEASPADLRAHVRAWLDEIASDARMEEVADGSRPRTVAGHELRQHLAALRTATDP